MLTPADRIVMLNVLYGVRVAVAPDGRHLRVTGPSAAVHAAAPMLRHRRDELLAYLHIFDAGFVQASTSPLDRRNVA